MGSIADYYIYPWRLGVSTNLVLPTLESHNSLNMFIKGPDHSAQVIPPLEKRTADGALSHDYFSL